MDLHIKTPQFTRNWDLKNDYLPPTDEDFYEITRFAPVQKLEDMGFCAWDEPDKDGNVLYLFPGEWYNAIPENYPMIDISGNDEKFQKGVSDNDIRFGCLPYGILRKV